MMRHKWLSLAIIVPALLISLPIGAINYHGSKVGFQTHQSSDLYLPVMTKSIIIGTGILFVTDRDGNREIYLMAENGNGQTNLSNHPDIDSAPSWSPDGTQIVFHSPRNPQNPYEIFVMAADGRGQTQLTNGEGGTIDPDWSPDGEMIAFDSEEFGPAQIYTMRTDGSEWKQLTDSNRADIEPDWSPDGSQIAFTHHPGFDNSEIYTMLADGTNQQQLTFYGNFSFTNSSTWSPDGSKIAFASNYEGNWNIFMMNPDGSDVSRLVDHSANDRNPVWSPDGSRLAFSSNRDGDYEIYVMNLNGSNLTQLTYNSANDYIYDWR